MELTLPETLALILARLDQELRIQTSMTEVTRLQLELGDWKIAEGTAGLISRSGTIRLRPMSCGNISRESWNRAPVAELEKCIDQ